MACLWRSQITYVLVLSTFAMLIIEINGLFLPKRIAPYNTKEKVLLDPQKRPFCNAFTGCGRKRSNLPAITPEGDEVEDSINSLLELSEEPAVEDLSRQIMSEAKLWEAIQEANLELNRRKQQQSRDNAEDDAPIAARSATANCALPPCYI
ncbi:cardioactive peptide [Sitophilus oryzae]|uniref:Cardioactive peptide n=1 Tax=Sitophilus oryzae TaxID=7048 RepID=A0A6J2XNV8_SITOR|nr:cardioactive peptide [Sitophilus oryzae]XP_030753059.1 cardioactive peptide [Sitophilus oryzae]